MSLRDQILTCEDLVFKDEYVPEWKVTVRIKSLTGTERNAYEESMVKVRGNTRTPTLSNYTAKLVARTLYDPNTDERIFTEADVVKLGMKNSAVLDRLFDIASELSGLSDDDIEALSGNSEPGQSDGSTSF